MEIGNSHIMMMTLRRWLCMVFAIMMVQGNLLAQQAGTYTIKKNKMFIEVNKLASSGDLDKFITQFNLSDLPLKEFIKNQSPDSLTKLGWKVDINNNEIFVISKPMAPFGAIDDPARKMTLTEMGPLAALFPSVNNGLVYGYNRFQDKPAFAVNNNTTTFFLRGYTNASRVMLAGSFNKWLPDALEMKRTANGWTADVVLTPGKYWYKFVVDGKWMTDKNNLLRENDGLGNINSVYFKTNVVFTLSGFTNAKHVFVAGSFNNWHEKELRMVKIQGGWQLPLYLAEGTHTYKFIVDGQWHSEEKKLSQLPDGNGGYNSVIEIGKPHLFKLAGYNNAQYVVLSGNFNDWRTDELFMNKTNEGWELPYVIGPGNYEYKFIVDGNWITDPANPLKVDNEVGTKNSYLIIDPNYTFRLKGNSKATSVFLAGDFNNWSPQTLAMQRQGDEWLCRVHLFAGKHLYKFIVDGKWIIDPGNKLWEENQYGTGNSIVWIEQ